MKYIKVTLFDKSLDELTEMRAWCRTHIGKPTDIFNMSDDGIEKWSYNYSKGYNNFFFYYNEDATLFKLIWL